MPLEPIAIIGIGCRFPLADTPEAFWQLMRDGSDAITEVPPSRWNVDTYYDPDQGKPDKTNTRWGGFLEKIDRFDPQFFGIAPREVPSMDPQQRLLLEVAWEALEDAGQIPEQLAGSKTGVFIGIGSHDHSIMLWQKPVNDPYGTTGTANSLAANRISYIFDFKGPSLAVDTACSSSLVAVHLACQSLWCGESSLALVGGVNVLLLPGAMIGFTKGGFMSGDGRCKSFDADANGYVRSEGAGIVVLKPLSTAQADGDRIYALIRGTATNQDGRTEGLAAPNLLSQIAVLQEAYRQAGVSPSEVQYIEAHGTGTKVGDRIELEALATVLAPNRPSGNFCAIGSVKTNIGHAETAAGIAGLIKVALSLKHRQIPPNLHFQKTNPAVDFSKIPLRVQESLTPWNNTQVPLLAGVNSFGFGGTNAHVVLEEAPPTIRKNQDSQERPTNLLTLSAKSDQALRDLAKRYEIFLHQHPVTSLADICFTANTGRSQFNHRLVVVASREQFEENLKAFSDGQEAKNLRYGLISNLKAKQSPVVFLFTGQGSQYVDMGRQLYETQPLFRETIAHCAEILRPFLDRPLLDILYPTPNSQLPTPLDQTVYTQPALFALEYSLATLWMSWGITPSVVMGHSIGEYVAACVAGVFSLEDGLKLIAQRARLMQALPDDGAMVAVKASLETVRNAIAPWSDVAIAAENGLDSFVISGRREAIDSIIADFTATGMKTTPLKVSHAFHSPLMEPMLTDFAAIAAEVTYHRPRLSIISNLTGDFITDEIATPQYWCLHLRQGVRFAQSIATLSKYGYSTFIEIGAQPTLLGMGRSLLNSDGNQRSYLWLPSLRSGSSDWQQLLHSLGELYLRGYDIDWPGFDGSYSRRLVSLPTYPFQRQRYWSKTAEQFLEEFSASVEKTPERVHPLLGEQLPRTETNEIRFQAEISQDSPIYLKDHCLGQTPVFPAAAYLEMALVAANQVLPSQTVRLENISIERPLTLPDNLSLTIQFILTPKSQDAYQFQIFSLTHNGTVTLRHAQGQLLLGKKSTVATVDLKQWRDDCPEVLSNTEHYEKCREQGLNYGLSFQGIKQLWKGGKQALGLIELPLSLKEEAINYQLHPTLLDASFQVLSAILETNQNVTYLPIEVECLEYYQSPSNSIWCWVQIQKNSNNIKADLHLLDETGAIIAIIKGLTLKAVNQHTLKEIFGESSVKKVSDLENFLYELVWQAKNKKVTSQKLIRNWLIFTDSQGIGKQLADILQEKGNDSILVVRGETYQKLQENLYEINPAHPEDFQELLLEITFSEYSIIHLWGLDEGIDLEEAQLVGCGSILHLVQAFSHQNLQPSHLWLVTRNTQAVGTASSNLNIQQAALWGLARVIRLEYPAISCSCLDLDLTQLSEDIKILQDEILNSDSEEQIAYRQNERYVARLVSKTLDFQNIQPFQLKISQVGSIDNLTFTSLKRCLPAPDEVEIEVCATGLNFRDVLNALGMLQPYLEQMGFSKANSVPFGGECAGKIVAVGEAVKNLQIGDEVIAAFALGSLASFVTVKAQFVVPKPKQMSFVEAATIPSTFLTAYYGLHYLAKIKPGDRLLIHAAAGGVGQAAVQLATRVGAEIFATASPPKWNYLHSMGVSQVMNSRNTDFAEAIMTLTKGKGVDLVLNSLNGEFIPKNLQVLAPEGRFVEIGKIGVWDEEQVKQFRDDISYFKFDLLEIAQNNSNLITKLLTELMQLFKDGSLKPLPYTVFESQESINAFRYLGSAKNIGKVVISLPQFALQDGSYLVTGGLGALGLQVAQWLVEKGAKHLILVGRNTPNNTAQNVIKQLEQNGVGISVIQADISHPESVTQILNSSNGRSKRRKKYPPLRGIIHAAGILDDGILSNLSWERFERVMAAKVQGAWNLHVATKDYPLDFFVCFSSIVSVLGSPGQGSYAAANAFLDALAHYRRSIDLPGLSINWGPWANSGMAVHLEQQNAFAVKGITIIKPEFGIKVLEALLKQDTTQAGVFKVDWSKFLSKLPHQSELSFFEAVQPVAEIPVVAPQIVKSEAEFRQKLASVPKSEQKFLLAEHIRSQLARVLGFSSVDQIELEQNFSDLGMDSLMAVEFKNNLQISLDISLSTEIAAEYPTVELLTDYFLLEILVDEPVPQIKDSIDLSPLDLTSPPIIKNGNKPPTLKPEIPIEVTNLPPQFYQFELSSEYISLKNDLKQANDLGNPFFMVRDGIASDITTINGKQFIHYSGYNYLGLSGDHRVSQAAQDAIAIYGTSVSASRVLSGEIPIHRELEQEIANLLGTEDCIVYIGGHTTNVTTISHLFRRNDLIFYDALSHNSIRQGCQMSGATLMEFPHNDWQTLEQLLSLHRSKYEKVLIVIEGVYSSDGDIAPLPQLVELKKRYHTFLMVDEAHSIGVLGASGRGIGEYFALSGQDVDLWMGTLSKSFASCGGYIAASQALIEYLKYTAPGFVFSVGMSPPNTASALAAIQLLKAEPQRVKQLQERSNLFLTLAQKLGLNTGVSKDTPIIPIIIGQREPAVEVSKELFKRGINVQPMVYPSVANDAARLRFFITCSHTEEQIHFTLETLAEVMMVLF